MQVSQSNHDTVTMRLYSLLKYRDTSKDARIGKLCTEKRLVSLTAPLPLSKSTSPTNDLRRLISGIEILAAPDYPPASNAKKTPEGGTPASPTFFHRETRTKVVTLASESASAGPTLNLRTQGAVSTRSSGDNATSLKPAVLRGNTGTSLGNSTPGGA